MSASRPAATSAVPSHAVPAFRANANFHRRNTVKIGAQLRQQSAMRGLRSDQRAASWDSKLRGSPGGLIQCVSSKEFAARGAVCTARDAECGRRVARILRGGLHPERKPCEVRVPFKSTSSRV